MNQTQKFVIVAFCAVLNASLAFLVYLLKLPLYLDLVGTFIAARFLGAKFACLTAISGIVLIGIVTTPTAFAYMGTGIILALAASAFVRFGYLRSFWRSVIFGIMLGVISAIVSAPVTTYMFGGVSFVGADAFTAFFRATGKTLWTSVFLGGLSTDPVDKVCASLLAFWTIRFLPRRLGEELSNSEK